MSDEIAATLPRQTRAFIVLVALVQGLLLYLAYTAQQHAWMWLAARGSQVYWYTLILAVPTMLTLSMRELNDRRVWQHAAAVFIVYALLASWAAWSVTGAPGIEASSVLMPFSITVGGALFVALPFLQCRQADGYWRAPYPELFDHAWQNGLTLLLACMFTGVCWLVLQLWAGLFALVHIHFFKDLFFDNRPFAFLATGLFAGLGILIGRTQQHPLRVARQILFAVCRGLLPLVALIALMFLASLPFTGLAPLWHTGKATALLLSLLLLLIVLINAVWQDGVAAKHYPRPLRILIDIALIVSPIYAGLALYALALRVGQYGWTGQRFWAVLVAVVLAGHALGYAVAAARRSANWLAWLPRVNVALACFVVALALLANSPALDPFRITVNGQLARLHAGRITPARFDSLDLRFDNGRRGYLAAVELQRDPTMRADRAALSQLTHVVARQRKQVWVSDAEQHRLAVPTLEALRAQIVRAPGALAPDDDWYRLLLSSRQFVATRCAMRGADCVVSTPDLRGDGRHENLLCNFDAPALVSCLLFARDVKDQWRPAESLTFEVWPEAKAQAMRASLRAGHLQVEWPYWPDVSAAGHKAIAGPLPDFTPPPAAASGAPPASH